MPKGSRKKAVEEAEAALTARARDMEQLMHAMTRVKDPMMRYMLTMFVDLASERIAQLEKPIAVQEVEMATKH